MSPLFADMLDEMNEASEVITLDFADEKSFAKALEFCEKSGYSERDCENLPRRLLAQPTILAIEELFKKNETEATLQDETWKVAFFKAMELNEVVQLANLANYVNIP